MFSRVIGNDEAKAALSRMLEAGRVPGALLFAGEDGIGKKLFALELAKALNCRYRQGVEPCDKCPACMKARVKPINPSPLISLPSPVRQPLSTTSSAGIRRS